MTRDLPRKGDRLYGAAYPADDRARPRLDKESIRRGTFMTVDCKASENADALLLRKYPEFDGVLKSVGPSPELIFDRERLAIKHLAERFMEVRRQLQKLNGK
jgi:hypothetical protein